MLKIYILRARTVAWVLCAVMAFITAGVVAVGVVRGAGDMPKEDGVQVPIVMYHIILKDKAKTGKYTVTPAELESDLKYLKENGYTTIVMQDLVDYVETGSPLPKKPIILTFDDGYYNNYYYAYPLMQQYDMKMVLSIVGSYVDLATEENTNNPNYSYVTWDQVREMHESGYVEIQNHSYDMHELSPRRGCSIMSGETEQVYHERLAEDLRKLQDRISDQVDGYRPVCFTYPFGIVSRESQQVVEQLGFTASLSCTEGMNYIDRDAGDGLYLLKRNLRPGNKSSAAFFKGVLADAL